MAALKSQQPANQILGKVTVAIDEVTCLSDLYMD